MAKLSIGDTIWLATALLHDAQPLAAGFAHETILRKVAQLNPSLNPRSVSTHLSTHCVASKNANPATLRILSENPDGSSQDEINAMVQLKGQSREPDVLDMGTPFAIKADQMHLLTPYKVSSWANIPASA